MGGWEEGEGFLIRKGKVLAFWNMMLNLLMLNSILVVELQNFFKCRSKTGHSFYYFLTVDNNTTNELKIT